jgi:hypothetical protein
MSGPTASWASRCSARGREVIAWCERRCWRASPTQACATPFFAHPTMAEGPAHSFQVQPSPPADAGTKTSTGIALRQTGEGVKGKLWQWSGLAAFGALVAAARPEATARLGRSSTLALRGCYAHISSSLCVLAAVHHRQVPPGRALLSVPVFIAVLGVSDAGVREGPEGEQPVAAGALGPARGCCNVPGAGGRVRPLRRAAA